MRSLRDSTLVERVAGNFQTPASAERSRKHTVKAKRLKFRAGEIPKPPLEQVSLQHFIQNEPFLVAKRRYLEFLKEQFISVKVSRTLVEMSWTDNSSLSLVDMVYILIFHLFLQNCPPVTSYNIHTIQS